MVVRKLLKVFSFAVMGKSLEDVEVSENADEDVKYVIENNIKRKIGKIVAYGPFDNLEGCYSNSTYDEYGKINIVISCNGKEVERIKVCFDPIESNVDERTMIIEFENEELWRSFSHSVLLLRTYLSPNHFPLVKVEFMSPSRLTLYLVMPVFIYHRCRRGC